MHQRRSLPRMAALLGLAIMPPATAWAQPGAPRVAAVAAIQAEVREGAQFVGTIKPLRRSIVGSAVDGRVEDFPVNEGEFIEAGRPLAKLKTESFEIQLAAAEAELKLRTIDRDELKKLHPEEINEAKARMEGAEVLRNFTKRQVDRVQGLYDRGTVTIEQLQESLSAADRATQSYFEARAAYQVVAGSEKVAKGDARVLAQQEEIRRLKDIIKKHTIVAPFSGYVVAEHVEIGQWVSPADPVAEMVDIETVEVDVMVPQDYIVKVNTKDTAGVQVDGVAGPPLSGTVHRIVPHGDVRARTFPVKIHLSNPRHVLKSGMLASVTLPVGERVKAVLVPKDALVLGGRRLEVFVVEHPAEGEGPPKVRAVSVQLGVSDGDWVEVKSQPPLKPGELVVVQGNERLVDGAAVEVTMLEEKKKFETKKSSAAVRADVP
jgi:HlyD family secretion protein